MANRSNGRHIGGLDSFSYFEYCIDISYVVTLQYFAHKHCQNMGLVHCIKLVSIAYAHIRWLIVTEFRNWFPWQIVKKSKTPAPLKARYTSGDPVQSDVFVFRTTCDTISAALVYIACSYSWLILVVSVANSRTSVLYSLQMFPRFHRNVAKCGRRTAEFTGFYP